MMEGGQLLTVGLIVVERLAVPRPDRRDVQGRQPLQGLKILDQAAGPFRAAGPGRLHAGIRRNAAQQVIAGQQRPAGPMVEAEMALSVPRRVQRLPLAVSPWQPIPVVELHQTVGRHPALALEAAEQFEQLRLYRLRQAGLAQPFTVPGVPLSQFGRCGGNHPSAERVTVDLGAGEGRESRRQAIVVGVGMGDDDVAQLRQRMTVRRQSGFQRRQRFRRIGSDIH